MAKFVIQQSKHLEGEVLISGMKNATTPILVATLLTNQPCVISNIPRIKDVEKMIEILISIGSQVKWLDRHTIKINNQHVVSASLNKLLVRSMRSSVLLLGAGLARFSKIVLPEPGGCIIGNRPLDTHFYALKKLGVKIEQKDGNYNLSTKQLVGNYIVLPEFSVTATENAILASVLARGKTTIKLAAAEPHVQDLCLFLNKMGAKIGGIGTHCLEIEGVKQLHGTEHQIIPDQIEIGTFLIIGALTRSHLIFKHIIPKHLEIILLKLSQIGLKFKLKSDQLEIFPTASFKSFKLQTLPYPGFPTDLQSAFGVLATQCQGTSLIQDPMFNGRMNYVKELIKMGANAIIADPHRVIITGPTQLYGKEISSYDLRSGAALIIAGLIAQGKTIINQVEIVDRGYESIEKKLTKLGAKIIRN